MPRGYRAHAVSRDENEPEIIATLERIGARVYRLDDVADLLVWYWGHWHVLECKAEKGGRLTPAQRKIIEECGPASLLVVRTPEEAIDAVRPMSKIQGT